MTLAINRVDKIYQRFGKPSVHAVQALDLEVKTGETVALLGSSGCGKTSTLRMIAGFETVTRGSITLAGRKIDTLPPARRGVAMAFETYALYPPLTVAENIGFALRADRSGRQKVEARVRAIADLLEIGSILDRRPVGLSGGQQQRASLARALVRDADLHLLDEPMSQLEPQLRAVLRGRVKALLRERGITAVFVTHDQTEANALADRIAVMEGGVLQQFGPPDVLRDRPANLFVATFLGEPPMNAIPGRMTTEGVEIRADEAVAFRVPLAGGDLPAPGTEVVIGIRPHRLQIGVEGLSGPVISNQWLGDQAHVALDVAGNTVVAVSDERVAAATGNTLTVGVDPADVHVFDAVSGKALRHGGEAA